MFSSLRVRLVVSLMAVLLMGCVGMAAFLSARSQGADELLEETSLVSQARDTLSALRTNRQGKVGLALSRGWAEAYRAPAGAFFTLYDRAGRELARSANLGSPLPFQPLSEGRGESPLQLQGTEQRLTQAVRTNDGGELVVARSNPGMRGDRGDDLWAELAPAGVLAVTLAVAGLLVVVVSGWSLAPLDRAARDAGRIGPDAPEARLPLAALPSEVRPLAQAVNNALDRVASAYTLERRFTADAAHALRTPLTVLDLRLQQLEAGGALDREGLRADVDELIRIVHGLLRLSRGERRPPADHAIGIVRLDQLMRETAAGAEVLVKAEGRSLHMLAVEELTVAGDAGALRDAISAIFDNARVHGSGRIRARLSRRSRHAVLEVADDGPGVARENRELVFERFYKAQGGTAGAGLGLAIVKQVAERHGGQARFVEAAKIELRIPCIEMESGDV